MKATPLLLLPAALLTSCSNNSEPVAPPVSSGDEYGVPGANAPYQPVQPINPPATPVPAPLPPPAPVAGTPAPTPVAPTAPATGTPYTIQAGDSLWGIARDNGTTVEAIKQLNGLTSDTIVAGKTLMIPAR